MAINRTLVACAVFGLNAHLSAQPQPDVEFEVASIKVNKSNSNSMRISSAKGFWRANNVTVNSMLINAFEVLPQQIAGAPAWTDSDRFDIEARYDGDLGLSKEDIAKHNNLRLQALLRSRFGLTMHRETKEQPSYVLLASRKGSKLTPSADGNSSMRASNGHVDIKGGDLENLARNLAFRLGRPVVNQTGIAGKFDITLDFEPEGPVGIIEKDNPIIGVDARKPSLFTALQDQLGLKLEARKAPIELLVIDRIERPSDN